MSAVDPSKWTCPHCPASRGTVTVIGSEPDRVAAVHAVQERHFAMHTRAASRMQQGRGV